MLAERSQRGYNKSAEEKNLRQNRILKDGPYTKGKEKSKKRGSKRASPKQPRPVKTPCKPHGQAADLVNFLQQTEGN